MHAMTRWFLLAGWLGWFALTGCGGGTTRGGGTTGPATYGISGAVSGAVAASVTISLTGEATGSTSTDGNGNYAFSGLANGSYTVTPSKSGFTFSPASLAVPISGASVAGQNFTANHASACPNDQTNCSNTCVDLQKDTSNCGTCGKACPAGDVCSAGACQVACASGLTPCGSACISLTSDAQNCGSCGNACASGSVCTSGSCVPTACASGLTNCGGNCVDIRSNGQNCGGCGTVCLSGTACSGGNCATVCASGQTNCSGSCVTLASDASNCGACGQACASGQLCANGVCVAACAEGQTSCSGACVDTQTDVRNCGKCANACIPNVGTCVAGVCRIGDLTGTWDFHITSDVMGSVDHVLTLVDTDGILSGYFQPGSGYWDQYFGNDGTFDGSVDPSGAVAFKFNLIFYGCGNLFATGTGTVDAAGAIDFTYSGNNSCFGNDRRPPPVPDTGTGTLTRTGP